MIDWKFISELEGSRLDGYIPDEAHSRSGVTVASGVDLGQMPSSELDALPRPLADRLRPYIGVQGPPAEALLKAAPLRLSAEEAELLNGRARAADVERLRRAYGPGFDALPAACQTVLASVTFQYGTPWARTPHLWAFAKVDDWGGMVSCLRHFGDHYQTRHDREADYLETHFHAQVPS